MSQPDHSHPEAVYARLINRADHLQRAVDRIAEHSGLRDDATIASAVTRLSAVVEELRVVTGVDHTTLIPRGDRPTPGELLLAAGELIGVTRAAAWWNDEHATRTDHDVEAVGTTAYL